MKKSYLTHRSPKHLELISIGHSVNVRKIIKENCFLGMDSYCAEIVKQYLRSQTPSLMPEGLNKTDFKYEFWFGVEY